MNDVDFKIKVIDKNESFDQFFTRFNITIASLNWDDDMKKHHFRRSIITRLARQMIILDFSHSFVVICNRLRQIDRINNTLDKKQDKEWSFTKSKSRRTRDFNTRSNRALIKNSSKKENWDKRVDKLSREIREKIKRKKLCFKCDKSNHRFNDTSICKKAFSTISKELAKMLELSLTNLAQMNYENSNDTMNFDENFDNWSSNSKNV